MNKTIHKIELCSQLKHNPIFACCQILKSMCMYMSSKRMRWKLGNTNK